MSAEIASVHAREILDSRGRPTVEADVVLADGTRGRASVPSGASTGSHESVERRDGDLTRYGGLGVRTAVANVEQQLGPAVVGLDATDQALVDATLRQVDGTENRARLGVNAGLAVSLASARAAAAHAGEPLWRWIAGPRTPVVPLPMVNLISGGLHAEGGVDIQDVLVVPVGAESFADALALTYAVRTAAGSLLAERGLTTLKADEGGFGPPLASNTAALRLAVDAIELAGLEQGRDVALALDVAAVHLTDAHAAEAMQESVAGWCSRFPLVSVEDPLGEDDWDGWATLTRRLGERVQIVGDDFFTTRIERLERGAATGAANAVLVKMNQIGTLTETLAVVDRAHELGYRAVVSARSGETEDDLLADLAVGSGAGQIKVGSLAQSERLAKYNQLLRITEELPAYAGRAAIAR